MKTRIVKQYCCEFCKKRGLSASHMAKHERHCTMNPQRVCNVCRMINGQQHSIEELKAAVPQQSKDYWLEAYEPDTGYNPGKYLNPEANESVENLRKLTNCPACILAALRQSNIPVWRADAFNFTQEMKAIWDNINDAKQEADMRACHCG